MQVHRRHVIFLQGYDPRGIAAYYRMFRTELKKFGALYGLSPSISRPQETADGLAAKWTIETAGEGWATSTQYEFLRWEDLVQQDRTMSTWRLISQSLMIYLWIVFRGILAKFSKAHWRFAVFITYPYLVLLAEILLSMALAGLAKNLGAAVGLPDAANIAASLAIFAGVLAALIVKAESRTYMLYLMADTIFTYQFGHRQRKDWDARIEHFAQHLVNVAKTSTADELLIVGHSSGSFLGTEILSRALEIDPALGRHHARVVLLTVGGNLPIIGFLPVSAPFRENLRRLAINPDIDWIDGQSRKDVMNFFPFDPIKGHGLDVGDARRNPTIYYVRLRDLIAPERYNLFRWHFFRVHFQFVMANDQANAYDYFMMVCGPISLPQRIRNPEEALAVATGTPAAREAAWQKLLAA